MSGRPSGKSGMSNSDLEHDIARMAGVNLGTAREILESMLNGMKRTLQRGGQVNVRGFGTLRRVWKKPHKKAQGIAGAPGIAGPVYKIPVKIGGRWAVQWKTAPELQRRVWAGTAGETVESVECAGTGCLSLTQLKDPLDPRRPLCQHCMKKERKQRNAEKRRL